MKIGKDAERVGVGTDFFQRAILNADKFGLKFEQVVSALQHAREVSDLKNGEGKDGANASAIDGRLTQDVRAGNLTAADKATFDNAGSQEAKIRAVLDLIDKLRASQRDLAAFDLAGKFFGPDFERQLRNGVDLTNQLRDTLNSTSTTVAGVRIVGADEVERANQLDAKAKDIADTFANALAPIQRDISSVVLDTYGAFRNVEAVIARIVGIAANLFTQISGIVGQIRDLVGSIPGVGKIITAGKASEGSDAVGGFAGLFKSGMSELGGYPLPAHFAANGGPVNAGQPTTVGEMGRELFVPDQSGRVYLIIAPPTGGDSSSPAVNVYNNGGAFEGRAVNAVVDHAGRDALVHLTGIALIDRVLGRHDLIDSANLGKVAHAAVPIQAGSVRVCASAFGAAHGGRAEVGHVRDHRGGHPLGVGLLALQIRHDGALGLGGDEVGRDRLVLAEAPEPTHGLVNLLLAVVEPDEAGVGAVLEVQPVAIVREKGREYIRVGQASDRPAA